MKILVLIKVVPDTWVDRSLTLETGLAVRTPNDAVVDEINERTLEVALKHADAHEGTEVVVLTMAPEIATASLRKALAVGATHAVHVLDDALVGADIMLTAEVLAAAARRIGFDVILAGNYSTDGGGGAVPVAMAELLEVPAATSLAEVSLTETTVTGVRATDDARVRLEAALPAVVSVTEQLPAARMPNFKGIMAAKKMEIEMLSLADLGVDPLPADAARTIMVAANAKPAREAGTKIVDEGDAGQQLADFLVQKGLV